VLLLPGLHGTAALWPWFRAAWRAVGGDEGIASLTYPTDPACTLDDYIACMEAAIGGPAGPGPVDLIAESFSGPIALRVAARGHVPIRRVVLVASFAGALRPGMLSLSHLVPLRLLAHPPRWAIAHLLANGVADRAVIADIVATVRAIPPALAVSRLRLLARLDADALRCTHPVLYLQATRDRLVPPSALADVRHCCPDLTVTTIAAPHLLMQCSADAAAVAIRAFLTA
jgi:pimeloyl-ACP methyl ester carboxylesterase